MWPEVEKARNENRHELVLGGASIAQRIKDKGFDGAIFTLTSLNFLDLHDVPLGAIPEEISKLGNLQSLVLHSNQLEVVCSGVCQLVKLKLLDLSRNQIRELPDLLGNLCNLTTLNLAHNQLGEFPNVAKATKLAVVDLSNNKLAKFADLCHPELANLAELRLSNNLISVIPAEIDQLAALKVLELAKNQIKVIPKELSACPKLKNVDLKDNPVSDRRLLKLIDQCRPKQILDYVQSHCVNSRIIPDKSEASHLQTSEEESDDSADKPTIRVQIQENVPKITIADTVTPIRPYFVACLVDKIALTQDLLKIFLKIQNKLHDNQCVKRTLATIATHDYAKLPPGDLLYCTKTPSELVLRPLNRNQSLTGEELFRQLQLEADNLRKEKKRSVYTGIHKYLGLIEGRPQYPCLVNSEGVVISFPPITNSEDSKISVTTTKILVEVTSSTSLHVCKTVMEALLREMLELFSGDELEVIQLRTYDQNGLLKVAFPSKSDLDFNNEIRIIRT